MTKICCFCLKESILGGFHFKRLISGEDAFRCRSEECARLGNAEVEEVYRVEREKLRGAGLCWFDQSYVGFCKKKPIEDSEFCDIHAPERCWKCKSQAVKDCVMAGSLVCGTPECEAHPHKHHG